jgi:hypothetical protein
MTDQPTDRMIALTALFIDFLSLWLTLIIRSVTDDDGSIAQCVASSVCTLSDRLFDRSLSFVHRTFLRLHIWWLIDRSSKLTAQPTVSLNDRRMEWLIGRRNLMIGWLMNRWGIPGPSVSDRLTNPVNSRAHNVSRSTNVAGGHSPARLEAETRDLPYWWQLLWSAGGWHGEWLSLARGNGRAVGTAVVVGYRHAERAGPVGKACSGRPRLAGHQLSWLKPFTAFTQSLCANIRDNSPK